MSTYTQAPWHVHHSHGYLVVESANEELFVQITKGIGKPKDIANARLIAAAPELLEALQLICADAPDIYPERYEGDNHGDTAYYASEQTHFNLAYIARAATAKAEGKQTC